LSTLFFALNLSASFAEIGLMDLMDVLIEFSLNFGELRVTKFAGNLILFSVDNFLEYLILLLIICHFSSGGMLITARVTIPKKIAMEIFV
jgi:hypothetical protein